MLEAARNDPDRGFERLAGAAAIAVGLGGVAYGVTFLVVLQDGGRVVVGANASFLFLGGLLTTAVLVALYRRVREAGPALASWALLLGIVGAVGATVHGAFDLANVIHQPEARAGGLPNAIDPRGVLTFGLAGVATLAFATLIARGRGFPRRLGHLGYVLGVLLVLIYLGRLIILDPNEPALLGAAALAGFVVNPIWYVWLGLELRRGQRHD